MINKVILVGRLGKDPAMRYATGGNPIANFSVATSEKFTDKSGQRQERTEWHNIVLFARLAEVAQQFLKKGMLVYVEGRIQTRSWDDKEGNKRYTTEIIGHTLQMLSSKKDSGGTSAEMPAYMPSSENAEALPAAAVEPLPSAPAQGDDDLPF